MAFYIYLFIVFSVNLFYSTS